MSTSFRPNEFFREKIPKSKSIVLKSRIFIPEIHTNRHIKKNPEIIRFSNYPKEFSTLISVFTVSNNCDSVNVQQTVMYTIS